MKTFLMISTSLICLLFLGCTSKKSVEPQQVTPLKIENLRGIQVDKRAPSNVYFDADVSGGTEPTQWYWEFGDLGTSDDQKPQFSFYHQGTFMVVLTVTSADHQHVADTVLITVLDPFALVVSAIAAPSFVTVNTMSSLIGDVEGGIPPCSFAWKMLNGTLISPSKMATFTPDTVSITGFIFEAYDSDNRKASDTVWVEATNDILPNQAPIIIGIPVSRTLTHIGGYITFMVDAFDPDGDITAIRWDFDDGETATMADTSDWITHTFNYSGLFDVTVEVEDDDGAVSRYVRTVEISRSAVNNPPVLIARAQPLNGIVNETVFSFHALESYDPEGDLIEFFMWKFSDGGAGYDKIVEHVFTTEGLQQVILIASDMYGATSQTSCYVLVSAPE